MTYVPTRLIIKTGNTLSESLDLTVSLNTLTGIDTYLAVYNDQNKQTLVLSIANILMYQTGLNKTLPLSSVFSTYLNDAFVLRYLTTTIPLTNDNGYYPKRIRVLNPISYKTYNVSFTSTNTPTILDEPAQRGFLDDLVITSGGDPLNNALVAVNGVFHKTALVNDALYVIDGFRTMRLTDRKDMTLIDTTNIGGHAVYPITPDMVSQTTYNDWATITLPAGAVGKTLAVVIDGYFYHLDTKVISYPDSNHIRLRTNLMPLIQQFRHNPRTVYRRDLVSQTAETQSRRYNDPYADDFLDQRTVPASVFETAAFQLSRISAYHSFIVAFNTPNLYYVERELISEGTIKFYRDYSNDPLSGMMSYGCGLCPSYLLHQESGGRKEIFMDAPDCDLDLYLGAHNPVAIPTLNPMPKEAADLKTRLIDYYSA